MSYLCSYLVVCLLSLSVAMVISRRLPYNQKRKSEKMPRWRDNSDPMDNTTLSTRVVGERMTFRCSASGSPKPKVTWLKNGLILTSTMSTRMKMRKYNLKLIGVERTDSGNYTCIISNRVGNIQWNHQLLVKRRWIFPENVTTVEGGSATFRCGMNSGKEYDVRWVRYSPRGHLRRFSADNYPNGENHDVLRLTRVTFTDAGKYTCWVGGVFSIKTFPVWLTVVHPTTAATTLPTTVTTTDTTTISIATTTPTATTSASTSAATTPTIVASSSSTASTPRTTSGTTSSTPRTTSTNGTPASISRSPLTIPVFVEPSAAQPPSPVTATLSSAHPSSPVTLSYSSARPSSPVTPSQSAVTVYPKASKAASATRRQKGRRGRKKHRDRQQPRPRKRQRHEKNGLRESLRRDENEQRESMTSDENEQRESMKRDKNKMRESMKYVANKKRESMKRNENKKRESMKHDESKKRESMKRDESKKRESMKHDENRLRESSRHDNKNRQRESLRHDMTTLIFRPPYDSGSDRGVYFAFNVRPNSTSRTDSPVFKYHASSINLWMIYVIVGSVAGAIVLLGVVTILVAVVCNREDEATYKSTTV